MFPTVFPITVTGMIALGCVVGLGYEHRMKRGECFVDVGRLTTKKQIKLAFGVGFALFPVLIVVLIFSNYLPIGIAEFIAVVLLKVQLGIAVLFWVTMDIVCKVQARKNNIIEKLPIILNQKNVLDGSVVADYDFLKHELYLWYGTRYTTKEIDTALTKLELKLK